MKKMPLDNDQASVTIRTNVRRGFPLNQAREEARAIVMLTDALNDLNTEAKRRVIRFIASKYQMRIDKEWLFLGE